MVLVENIIKPAPVLALSCGEIVENGAGGVIGFLVIASQALPRSLSTAGADVIG
jgi:hypothetical protein